MPHRPAAALSPLILAGALSLLCWGCGEPSTAKPAREIPLSSPDVPVTAYLADGTDVSGKLLNATPTTLVLETGRKPPQTFDRRKVQGLILATKAEQAVAERITTSADLWIAAGKYVYAARQEITSHLKPVPCDTGNIPVLHGQLNKAGKLLDLKLLASSGCKALDEAVIAAFRATDFKPLPKIYPLDVYPVNYYYEPETADTPTHTSKEKPAAKTGQSVADPSPR